ncbi:unnamed protein product [Plutella xylostella]|uniref:(diamondback moth) hypothetical protein n=1 Tax=Plutella xylostella TaxID=51655 RepID=A0A8S4FYS9_PLUXY|nr:unnamed protein product [Plutella xylostella]
MLYIKLFLLFATFTGVLSTRNNFQDFIYKFGPDRPHYIELGRTEGQIERRQTKTGVYLNQLASPSMIRHVTVTVTGSSFLDTPESVLYDEKIGLVKINYSLRGSLGKPKHYVVVIKGIIPFPLTKQTGPKSG